MNAVTESKIRDICLVLALIGLGVLHVSHSYLEADRVSIGEIERKMMGDTVTVEASVEDRHETENAVFLDLKDETGEIDAVDFDKKETPDEGNFTGRVEVHRGNLQLVIQH